MLKFYAINRDFIWTQNHTSKNKSELRHQRPNKVIDSSKLKVDGDCLRIDQRFYITD
ncbi:MAG: hypothetical protein HXY43_06980 [Fischerella sp.]|uniref:hypothetical protein n=1 Tax=unclassified Fischerella TaxID=494603 RepID=UPI0004AEA243|nr:MULTISPECIES: hypothetical protein [unclassified Fischerella]NWF59041.1 hypothetical protein [Fischerella sp.]